MAPAVTFVLAPLDQGVRNVGGRDGAAMGPRRVLSALLAQGRLRQGSQHIEVATENTEACLERDLDALSGVVADTVARGRLPVVLGGDHGTTYATVRGLARARPEVGVAYLDVHFDLREYLPRHTSGSSFRRLIEEGIVPPLQVRPLGMLRPTEPTALARSRFDELAAWAVGRRVAWKSLADVRREGPARAVAQALSPGPAWCFSLDVDAIDSEWAPGVSAPGEGRFTLEEATAAARAAAGRCAVFDVVEYAPRLDQGGRTLRSVIAVLDAFLGALEDGPG